MQRFFGRAALTLVAACALAGTAQASPEFTWNPRALQLSGAKFSADSFSLGDYARIVMSGDLSSFTDTGYMPITGFSLNGQAVTPPGYDAADGSGWGAYIAYSAQGTQTLANGFPVSATFTALSYQIIGYNGLASFGFDAAGAPTVSVGGRTRLLASGSLISGGLSFVPVAGAAPTIEGSVLATVNGPPQFWHARGGELEVNFLHPAADYAFTSPTTIQIGGGDLSSANPALAGGPPGGVQAQASAVLATPAVAAPALAVPEPSSLLLLLSGAVPLLGLRRGRAARARA